MRDVNILSFFLRITNATLNAQQHKLERII